MTDPEKTSELMPEQKAKPIHQPGQSPERDAWFTAFFIENHLDYFTFPDEVCSPEQVRFMVYTEGEERYYPCSDRMFDAIMNRTHTAFLQGKYRNVLLRVLGLVDDQIEDGFENQYLKSLLEVKFRHETRDEIMIPSRLEKRLLNIFLRRTQIEDPFGFEKTRRNSRTDAALKSAAFRQAINHLAPKDRENPPETLQEIRSEIDRIHLKRLFAVSAESAIWETDRAAEFNREDYLEFFNRPMIGDGVEPLFRFLGVHGPDGTRVGNGRRRGKKMLWLAHDAGEFVVDIAVIRYLADMGHKIIIAVKEGPLYTHPDFSDIRTDDILVQELEKVLLIEDKHLSKNDLVAILRSDRHIMALSDGTFENLNLPLTSTTFTRIFKEVDGVISRGPDQRRRFFDAHFRFTQDIYNISRQEDGAVSISFKPRHEAVIKFSHEDLEMKALAIIDQMRAAKSKGMTVMFYSGIIGSIPGRIDMAKKIMSVTIQYLKERYAETFIINPSEYYEPGMDADDLMYMWEIVQRSGYIDTWRFQTYSDIFQAFQIMGRKVPPEWVGKDATYSTGCTKEVRIAQEVLNSNPEMQITGPPIDKFMRRKEYGVGTMYDRRLAEVCRLP